MGDSHKGSPWEKGAVERSLGSVATLFAQYAAGYVGPSVEQRGRDAERAAAWSVIELQDLLDERIAVWQNRPHDGLRHPLMPGKALTPHQRTGGMIGSLTHLIRGAAIEAILNGTEQITRQLLDGIGLDHAAESSAGRGQGRHR
jgi:hypothetical protein